MRSLVSFAFAFTFSLALMVGGTAYSQNGQVVLNPTDDAWIWMENPDENSGADDDMHVRNTDGAGSWDQWEKDALVKFDLSSIPPGSVISSAKLYLYYHYCSFGNCDGRDLNCRRITSFWDEGAVTWNTRPSVAVGVTDHAIVPSSFGWMDWDVTPDVQAIVDGEANNHGWEIMDEVPWGSANIPDSRFRTKEYGDYVPYLEITLATDDWPMFHHDLPHTGYSTSTAPDTNEMLWSYTAGSFVQKSPAIVDGRVYLGSTDGKVYCLDASTGEFIWSYTTGGYVNSSPAVSDGKVYVGSNDDKVYCLDASTGDLIWSYSTGDNVLSSPVVAEGKVYVGSNDNKVYCLDALTGDSIWTFTTGDDVWSSPAVADGRVYVGSDDGKLYCLPLDDPNSNGIIEPSEVIWSYTTFGQLKSSPAIADGKVYVGSAAGLWGNKFYCLDALTGASIWEYELNYAVWSSPAVAYGMVYFGASDNTVYCLPQLDPNGDGIIDPSEVIWSYTTGGDVHSSPAVADDKVYVGSYDRKVYCLNASSGDLIWSHTTGGFVRSSPAVSDAKVCIGSNDNKLYCFGSSTEPIPTLSEWGMLIMGLLSLAVGMVVVARTGKAAVSKPV